MTITFHPPPPILNTSYDDALTTLLASEFIRLLTAYASRQNIEELDQQKNWLVGSKQSLADAIIDLQGLLLKQAELKLKTEIHHTSHTQKNFDEDDMRIIEQFLDAHTAARSDHGTDLKVADERHHRKRPATVKRDTASEL